MQVEKFNNPMDPAQILPTETMHNIMGRLDQFTLGKCEAVSKSWQELASDDSLWKDFLPRATLILMNGVKLKSQVAKPYITSPQQLIERIRQLAAAIPFFDRGHFKVNFPRNPSLSRDIEIDISWGTVGNKNRVPLIYEETFTYTKTVSPRTIRKKIQSNMGENTFFKARINTTAAFIEENILMEDGSEVNLMDEINKVRDKKFTLFI